MTRLDKILADLKRMSQRAHHSALERQTLAAAAQLIVALSNEQAAKAWREGMREKGEG